MLKGVDCSGYLYLAGRRAGMPVKRSTSKRMAQGLDGWVGKDVPSGKEQELDLPFWTFKPDRPNGHVGVFWEKGKVTHASPSRDRVVVDKLKGVLKSKLSLIRRLTLGDAPGPRK